MRTRFGFGLLILLLFVLSSCNVATPSLPLPDLATGEWTQLAGSTDTVCANGSEFNYFGYKGTQNKLVIDFQGGGACWDGLTCSSSYAEPNALLPDGVYVDRVSVGLETEREGIYDHDNTLNPVKDWYHVFIPYCTGDLHLGNNSASYTNPISQQAFTVEHKGSVNAGFVLDWVFDNFESPETIFITGCSAGAYAAAFWTDSIKAQYPDTQVYQMGDCGAGVSTDQFSAVLNASWNISANFPDLVFDANATTNSYIQTANKYKDSLKMAQYNTTFDSTQIGFFALATGNLNPSQEEAAQLAAQWSQAMQTSLATISTQTETFSSFTKAGQKHCIITDNDFYTVEENGETLISWLASYLNGDDVPSIAPAPVATTN